MYHLFFLLCGLILFLGVPPVASANTIDVPLTDSNTEGNSNMTTGGLIRIQQVFASSERALSNDKSRPPI